MKIGFIVNSFPAPSETFVMAQIVDFLNRGHDIKIFAGRGGGWGKPEDARKQDLECRINMVEMPGNYVLRLLKAIFLVGINLRKRPALAGTLNFLRYGRCALSLHLLYMALNFMREGSSCDIYHCQFAVLGLNAAYLREAEFINGKITTSFRGSDISSYVASHGDNVYDALFRSGDHFFPVCDYFRKKLEKLGCEPSKITVHRSGIDLRRLGYRFPKRTSNIFITAGRLIEKKGVEYGLRAFSGLVRGKNEGFKYHIIGDGPLMEDLKELSGQLGITEDVIFHGWKPYDETVEMVSEANVFLAPSVTDSSDGQEGIPNTIKEAMAMGTIVISTRHSGIPELIEEGETGYIVPERDPEALMEKMLLVLNNRTLLEEIARRARRKIEQDYDIKKLNEELEAKFSEILAERANNPAGS